MTQQVTTRHDRLHQEVWELLPWYINETLSPQERALVESHLLTCTDCQAERERCEVLAVTIQTAPQDTWEPSAEHFHRLMAHIDAQAARQTLWQRWWQRLMDGYTACQRMLQQTPRPLQWTLAAQGALALLLLAVVVLQGALPPAQPQYQTLTSGGMSAPSQQPQWRVVFVDSMTEKDLRALLHSLQVTIVQGPSSVGVYTLTLSPGEHTPAEVQAVLTTLRAHPQVRLAEPLEGQRL